MYSIPTGNVSISGDYKYTSPKTYYLNIPTAAFVPVMESFYNYLNTGSYLELISGNYTLLSCPVYLPQGATVTEFRTYCFDDDASYNVGLRSDLDRQNLNENMLDYMAWNSLSTVGASSSIQAATSTSIIYPTIDNENNQYSIYVNFCSDSCNNNYLCFYGCRIAYTMDTIAP
jgi:hypothetical protein